MEQKALSFLRTRGDLEGVLSRLVLRDQVGKVLPADAGKVLQPTCSLPPRKGVGSTELKGWGGGWSCQEEGREGVPIF